MRPSIHILWKWLFETVLVLALVLVSFLTILTLLNLFFPSGQSFFEMIKGFSEESFLFSAGEERDRLVELKVGDREQDLGESSTMTATLSRMTNNVQSRRSAQFAWTDAIPGMILFDRDAVQTGKRSSARLVFGKNSYLDMDESSLIIIRSLERDVFLNASRTVAVLVDGQFQGVVGRPESGSFDVKLVTPGAVARIPSPSDEDQPATFKMIVNRDDSSILTVYQGTADLQVQDETLEVSANQIVKVQPGEQPIFLLPPPGPPALISPVNDEIFTFRDVPPRVSFTWKVSDDKLRYRFVLASDQQFEHIVYEEVTDRPRFSHGNLKPGEYFWHVSSIDAEAEGGFSRIRRFQMEQDLEPPLLEVQYSEDSLKRGNRVLRGRTDADAEVFVNGIAVPTDEQGLFEHALDLKRGWNVIVVESVDHVGNVAYFSRTLNLEF
jgi:hypothetical protein